MSIEAVIKARAAERTRAAIHADVLELFDELAPGLYRFLRSRRLPEDAIDDIVQDTFMALFRHLSRDGARDNLHGWIFEVGRRLALKHQARSLRRLAIELPWTPAAGSTIDPAGTPEALVLDEQRHARLQRVLGALPDRDRACVLLRAEGLRYRDIAQALGISLGGVSKALTRALRRLANSDL